MLRRWLGIVFLGGLLSGQAPSTYRVSETLNPGAGLQFVPPEELRGIPLAELPYAGFELPSAVDLSEHMPPPGHQAQQNSCAAWASAYAVKTYQEKLEQRYQLVDHGQPHWSRIFSPAFVYNQINQGRDGGATLVDALNLLRSKGALSWADMPYLADNITQYPSSPQLQKARRFRIAYWRQVNVADVMELKSHVHAGYPVMTGMLIDQSFYHLKKSVWDRFDGTPKSGHAVVVVGFDDHKHAFKVMNSWGQDWSEGGYGWISYRHFRKAAREAYVAKDAWNDPPLPLAASDNSISRNSRDRFGTAQELKKDRPVTQAEPAEKPSKSEAEKLNDAPQAKPNSPAAPGMIVAPKGEDSRKEEADNPGDDASGTGVWKTTSAENTPQQGFSFSGTVTFASPLPHPEVILHFYTVSDHGEERQAFYSDSSEGTQYQLPTGQLALKAVLKDPVVTPQGVVYVWQATLPTKALGSRPARKRLRAQPVFYTDKFGVSKGPLIP
jgi:hypothetical protein